MFYYNNKDYAAIEFFLNITLANSFNSSFLSCERILHNPFLNFEIIFKKQMITYIFTI